MYERGAHEPLVRSKHEGRQMKNRGRTRSTNHPLQELLLSASARTSRMPFSRPMAEGTLMSYSTSSPVLNPANTTPATLGERTSSSTLSRPQPTPKLPSWLSLHPLLSRQTEQYARLYMHWVGVATPSRSPDCKPGALRTEGVGHTRWHHTYTDHVEGGCGVSHYPEACPESSDTGYWVGICKPIDRRERA